MFIVTIQTFYICLSLIDSFKPYYYVFVSFVEFSNFWHLHVFVWLTTWSPFFLILFGAKSSRRWMCAYQSEHPVTSTYSRFCFNLCLLSFSIFHDNSNFRFRFQHCGYINSTQVSHYFISQTLVNKVYTTLVYRFYITFVDVSHIWGSHSARNFVCMGML